MLIALLAVLGVDLIVLVAIGGAVLARKRWVKHQPGAFRGVIRVTDGAIDGLGAKWSRGYGRWVRDVLVWTKAPLYFRNELIPSDGLVAERLVDPAEVKRLGDGAMAIRLRSDGGTIEVGAGVGDRGLVRGPHTVSAQAIDGGGP